MTSTTDIKAAMDRLENVVTRRPSEGRKTKSVLAEIVDGVQCRVAIGDFTVMSDQPPGMGGDSTAPSPGSLARAGLAACLAQGYAMKFAQAEIPVERITVEVQCDLDVASFFGFAGAVTGFHELRYIVDIDSPADPTAINAAIEDNDAGSFVLQSFIKPVPTKGEVRINQARDAAE